MQAEAPLDVLAHPFAANDEAVDPAVAAHLRLTDLDACFDDASFLRHVPAVIARLDTLEAEIHVTN